HSIAGAADPRVNCLSYGCWTLWYLGYPDQALQRSQEAVALAAGLSIPFSLAYALGDAAWLHALRREGPLARERAEALITLATEQGFPWWLAWGTRWQGWALAEQGQVEEGIARMRQSGGTCIAEAYGKVGQVEEGLTVVAAALAWVDKTGGRQEEAELYRLKGELTLAQSRVQGLASSVQKEKEAEECFHKAIEIARRQS